jgi:sigma-B regulation protein RsbU (phosphoserine phosphatase)
MDEDILHTDESEGNPTSRRDRKISQLNKDLSSVRETSQLFSGLMELNQVLELVVKTVAQAIGADAAGLRLLDSDNNELVLKATYNLSEAYVNKGPVTAGESVLNKRALAGEVIVVTDMQSDPHFEKYHDEVEKEGLVSGLTLGLIYREKGIGMLRLYSKSRREFTAADISTAQIVAAQSAMAIMNARLYAEALEGDRIARQVRLAGQVQRHLIPQSPPDIPGIQLAGRYVPSYDVGGDFYDFIDISRERYLINIGDVMGKGVPASLAMASLRSSLRAYAAQFEDLQRYVTRANRMFCRDIVLGEFATLFAAEIDPGTGVLTYCNCGHEPPMHVRDGQVSELSEGGTIIGLSPDSSFAPGTVQLDSGDMLLLYTDGLADAFNFEHEAFGRERIRQAALESASMPAEQAAKNILWLMRKFAGLTQRSDDTALVVLKKL